jgi:peptidoglycan/LPS O-acetylase OafA/YrhL
VVLFHFAPHGLVNVAPLGVTAVSFFFFLSGVVLTLNYFHNKPLHLSTFLIRRFARIYPVYLLALLLTLIFGMVLHDARPKGLSVILQLLSIQSWVPGYCTGLNFPSWSVSVEFFFYAAFPFLVKYFRTKSSKQMLVLVAGLWVISFVQHFSFLYKLNGVEGTALHQFTLYFPIWHLNTFMFGMLCGRYIKEQLQSEKHEPSKARWLYGIGVLLFIVIVFTHNPIRPFISGGFLAPLFFLIIAGLALDDSPITLYLGHRFNLLLGNSSYALYILQWPIYLLFTWLFEQKKLHLMPFMIYLFSLIGISIVTYLFFEVKVKEQLLKTNLSINNNLVLKWIKRQ